MTFLLLTNVNNNRKLRLFVFKSLVRDVHKMRIYESREKNRNILYCILSLLLFVINCCNFLNFKVDTLE